MVKYTRTHKHTWKHTLQMQHTHVCMYKRFTNDNQCKWGKFLSDRIVAFNQSKLFMQPNQIKEFHSRVLLHPISSWKHPKSCDKQHLLTNKGFLISKFATPASNQLMGAIVQRSEYSPSCFSSRSLQYQNQSNH